MSRHTPGPWTMRGPWTEFFGIDGPNYKTVMTACMGHSYSEYTQDPDYIEMENEADAYLVLACPEMYEALVQIATSEVEWSKGVDENVERLRAVARTAIAKAEGRS